MDNPGKKKGKQKVCFKLPQKKRPHQLPTHPQTSIGRFSRQFEYGHFRLLIFRFSDFNGQAVVTNNLHSQRSQFSLPF